MSYRVQDHTITVAPSVVSGPPPIERLIYKVTQHPSRSRRGALVDRGANGGIIGSDARVMWQHDGPGVDACGIDNHKLTSLKLVDAAAKTYSNKGPVIVTNADIQAGSQGA